jgi:hypothetical protein
VRALTPTSRKASFFCRSLSDIIVERLSVN